MTTIQFAFVVGIANLVAGMVIPSFANLVIGLASCAIAVWELRA
jgi:hypothetical protein